MTCVDLINARDWAGSLLSSLIWEAFANSVETVLLGPKPTEFLDKTPLKEIIIKA